VYAGLGLMMMVHLVFLVGFIALGVLQHLQLVTRAVPHISSLAGIVCARTDIMMVVLLVLPVVLIVLYALVLLLVQCALMDIC